MLPGTVFLGFYDVFTKKILSSNINERFLIALDFCLVGILVLGVTAAFGLPEIKSGFWVAFSSTVFLNIFAIWFFTKAFQKEDVSLVSPIRLISPPLTLLTGFIILKENPSLYGIIGVLVTFFGLWILLNSTKKIKIFSFREIRKHTGVLYAIAGSISFAISLPFDKKATITSSAPFLIGLGFFLIGFGNLVIGFILSKNKKDFFYIPKIVRKFLFPYIIIHSIGAVLTMQAINYSLAAYTSSVKRLWSFWAIIFSGAILKEKNIGKKLIAALIMLAGIVLTVALG
jgi:drug/metabolite transporter (DMT)-like permease|tara:strand:- start:3256 stop:4113 length:858 start_codon:yes stop_codon:yes gene_type:complete